MKFSTPLLLLLLGFTACQERLSPAWERLPNPSTNKLQAVATAGDSVIWIAGGLRYGEESLMKSTNRGNDWELMPEVFGQSWYDACFTNSQTGFLCGISGKTLRTLDGGQNWALRQLPGWLPMRSIAATEEVVLTVGGVAYDRGLIARSINQGDSWQIVDSIGFELRDVIFVNAQTAFACGFGTILKSTDAGLSWKLLPVEGEFFSALSFPTPDLGFAVGRRGSILRTQDGGESWEKLRNGNAVGKAAHFYNDVVFWDEETGYIVGDKGLVRYTQDAGNSWYTLEQDSKDDLFGILLSGATTGLIVGDRGSILRFTL